MWNADRITHHFVISDEGGVPASKLMASKCRVEIVRQTVATEAIVAVRSCKQTGYKKERLKKVCLRRRKQEVILTAWKFTFRPHQPPTVSSTRARQILFSTARHIHFILSNVQIREVRPQKMINLAPWTIWLRGEKGQGAEVVDGLGWSEKDFISLLSTSAEFYKTKDGACIIWAVLSK